MWNPLRYLKSSRPTPRRQTHLLVLEPRFMYDGAAVETALAVSDDTPEPDATEFQADVAALQELFTAAPAVTTTTAVVFVDTTVTDYETLISDIGGGAEVVLLAGDQDGFDQISEYLQTHSGIDAIHIISHGGPGSLSLGSATLTMASVDDHADTLAAWSGSLTENADILIYGCDVAGNDDGVALVAELSRLTGADVAASIDATGAAEQGGDWTLEHASGTIETSVVVGENAQEGYAHLLGNPTPDGGASTITSSVGNGTIDAYASVAALNDGGHVVAWVSNADGDYDIYLSVTTSGGGTSTFTFTSTATNETSLAVAALEETTASDPDFVITWSDSASNLYAKTYDIDGDVWSSTITINISSYTYIVPTPAVTGLRGGGFLVVWRDDYGNGNGTEINAAVYDNTGGLVSNFGGIPIYTHAGNAQYDPDVTQLDNGNLVIVWQEYDNANSDGNLWGQMINIDYQLMGGNFQITDVGSDDGDMQTTPVVAATGGGGFVVAWKDGGGNIQGKLYNDAGTVVSNLVMTSGGNNEDPDVTSLPDGGFLVSWTWYNGSDNDLVIQRYDASGALIGSAVTVNATSNYEASSALATLKDGRVLVVYQLASGGVSDIMAQKVAMNYAPVLDDKADPTLIPIPQDLNSADNTGTAISDLLSHGNVFDGNGSDLHGIAIDYVDESNGQWEYSLNGGSTWIAIDSGALGLTNALLLGDDANTRIRFLPNAGFTGTAIISFLAWDRTTGTSGGFANVSTLGQGGDTPFSLIADAAAIQVYAPGDLVTGGEINITHDGGDESNVAAAELSNGNQVTVWLEYDAGSAAYRLMGRITDTNGAVVVDTFLITSMASIDTEPVVTALSGGGFVVVWSYNNSGYDILYSLYDNNGTASAYQNLMATIAAADNQKDPDVAALDSGGFVIVWEVDTGADTFINGRTFSSSGVGGGSEFTVFNHASLWVTDPAVVAFSGGFGVAMVFNSTPSELAYATFDNSGTYGTSVTVTTATGSNIITNPDVAMTSQGELVVVWCEGMSGSFNVYGRMEFTSNWGTVFTVSESASYMGAEPVVAAQGDGFAVSWTQSTISDNNVYIRFYDNTGGAMSGATLVNVITAGSQNDPALLAFQGGFKVLWEGPGNDVDLFSRSFWYAPVITDSNTALSWTEGDGRVAIDAGLTLENLDGDWQGGGLTVAITTGGDGSDLLSVINSGLITYSGNTISYNGVQFATFSGGTGGSDLVILFDADATNVAVQALLTAIAFDNSATPPGTTARTVVFELKDGRGLVASTATTVNVAAAPVVNTAPTALTLSAASIPENSAAGSVVGTLTASDPDSGESFTYTLISDAGGAFALSGDQLVVADASLLDAETAPTLAITVEVTDSAGNTLSVDFILTVSNVNETPSAITLSAASIPENSVAGSVVGGLTASDPDSGESFTYTLVNDAGGAFALSGDQLVVADASLLDYETASTQVVTVLATDKGGKTVTQSFTIQVQDVAENQPPTALTLSGGSVREGSDSGSVVGTLSASDPDSGDTLTYALTDDAGGIFALDGDQLVLADASLLDYETAPTLEITVAVTDAAGHVLSQTFAITVQEPPNEPPTALTLSHASVAENSAPGSVVGTLSATDVNTGETFTYTLLDDGGGVFAIDGDRIVVAAPLDHEIVPSSVITVVVSDSAGNTLTQSFTITVSDVNEPPSGLALNGASVAEGSAPGTVVGTLFATDADSGESFTYTLLGDAGGAFSLVGDQVVVVNPALLDYEANPVMVIVVQATDSAGQAVTETFTIQVGNVNESPTEVTLTGGSVVENSVPGTVVGEIAVVDPEGDSVTLTLVDGAGLFTLDGNTLVVAEGAVLDYEQAASHAIVVAVNDGNGHLVQTGFTIQVQDLDETLPPPPADDDTGPAGENDPGQDNGSWINDMLGGDTGMVMGGDDQGMGGEQETRDMVQEMMGDMGDGGGDGFNALDHMLGNTGSDSMNAMGGMDGMGENSEMLTAGLETVLTVAEEGTRDQPPRSAEDQGEGQDPGMNAMIDKIVEKAKEEAAEGMKGGEGVAQEAGGEGQGPDDLMIPGDMGVDQSSLSNQLRTEMNASKAAKESTRELLKEVADMLSCNG